MPFFRRHRDPASRAPLSAGQIGRTGIRLRYLMAVVFTAAFFSVLGWKFYRLHLHPDTAKIARAEEERRFETRTRGKRGSILDARGQVLALDLACSTVAVDPVYARERGRNGTRLALLLKNVLDLSEREQGDLQNLLNNPETKTRYKVIRKEVDYRVATKLREIIQSHKLRCVIVKDEYNRSYPKGSLNSHVVGYATGNGGVLGVESAMDDYLDGPDGRREGRLTAVRREVVSDRTIDIRPGRGHDVHLTIDPFIQEAMEVELGKAMRKYRADGAWAVCMRTKTGEILGMASRPDYNPNDGGDYFSTDKEKGRNRCISYGFEPGSVIKPMSIAAAMNESKWLNANTKIDCERGQWRHGGHLLRDAGRSFDKLRLREVVMKSSNIGTAKAVLHLAHHGANMKRGNRLLYDYYHDFGFGTRSGLGLPAEDGCVIRDHRRWHPVRLSRVAIGQGIRVNAVQLCGAVNTIANDGVRVRPYIVERITSADGEVVRETKPTAVQRVIRPEVAASMREMMRKTVEEEGGTGKLARLADYVVAGKTGTAQKWDNVTKRYSDIRNVSSFVGFVPAHDPLFTLVVVLDEPKDPEFKKTKNLGGGKSAAPTWQTIAATTAHVLGVQRTPNALSQQAAFPGVNP